MNKGLKKPPCSLPQTTERSPASTFPIWAKSSERNHELMMFENAISPARRKRPGIANWRQDFFTSINSSAVCQDLIDLVHRTPGRLKGPTAESCRCAKHRLAEDWCCSRGDFFPRRRSWVRGSG